MADLKAAALLALLAGVLPGLCDYANGIRHFYCGYFDETEQPLAIYRLSTLLEGLGKPLLSTPILVFVVALLVRVAYRGWSPGEPEFTDLAGRLRPSRWGSTENRQGLVLALVFLALDHAIGEVVAFGKDALTPAFHEMEAKTTGIDPNQLSEILSRVGDLHGVVLVCLTILFFALAVRRFLPRERWRIMAIAVVAFLAADSGGVSWSDLAIDAAGDIALCLFAYFLVTRVIRWNLSAYVAVAFLSSVPVLRNAPRFLPAGSPEFFRPTVVQVVFLALAVAAFLLYGHLRPGAAGEGTDDPPHAGPEEPTRSDPSLPA